MQSKILSRRTLLIVGLTGLVTSLALFSGNIFENLNLPQLDSTLHIENIKNAVALPKQEQVSSEMQMRLKIPVINVDAPITPVGLTPDGAMDTPKGPDDVVWYELGPRPGDNGSAVIAGHYGHWKNGKGSVFDDLNKLKKGDTLSVADKNGATTTFVVREIRSYDPNAEASYVFISNDGKSHLNLITCEGAWNDVSKSYSERLVVFTDKE